MAPRRRLPVALLGLVLLGLGALSYLGAAAPAVPPEPSAGRYQVRAADSYVGYRIYKWGVVPVRGHFTAVAGELLFEPARPETSWARVRVPVASLESGNPTRTEVLLSEDFFDASRHPEMRFESRAIERGPDGEWQVSGVLTIRGVARAFVVPVTLHGDPEGTGEWALFSTRFHLDRRDFEVLGRRWSAGRAILGNEVEIELALAARRSGEV